MPKSTNSYQRLSHDVQEGVYYDRTPQKVLTMQDPYNPLSYQTVLETMCVSRPNTRQVVMENFQQVKK